MAHVIEEAKSGRASCRTCKKAIAKGELRFGEEADNSFGEPGDTTFRWHHLKCAAEKLPLQIKEALAAYSGDVPERAELDATIEAAIAKLPPPYPHADHAPTGRARCQGCGEGIAKAEVRVAVEREIDRGMGATKGAGYLHPRCAAAWVESQGGTHAELTEGLRKNTRELSAEELDKLFAEV